MLTLSWSSVSSPELHMWDLRHNKTHNRNRKSKLWASTGAFGLPWSKAGQLGLQEFSWTKLIWVRSSKLLLSHLLPFKTLKTIFMSKLTFRQQRVSKITSTCDLMGILITAWGRNTFIFNAKDYLDYHFFCCCCWRNANLYGNKT